MRALIVLLLSTCLASSAFALTPLPPQSPPATASAAGAALAIPTTINGKFVVGYEGRGDYVKNAQLAKHSGDSPSTAAITGQPEQLALDANGKAAAPATAQPEANKVSNAAPVAAGSATATAATAKPAMRSDSALSNDSTKLKPAAATATATTTPATPAKTQAAPSGMNNPMVLVGGRIQH